MTDKVKISACFVSPCIFSLIVQDKSEGRNVINGIVLCYLTQFIPQFLKGIQFLNLGKREQGYQSLVSADTLN